jgi:hypothetical protein
VLDGARPDVTAFLPMAMLIAGQEGKDVACHGPIDSSYLLNLNTSFAPFASAFFGGHSVEATLKSNTGSPALPSAPPLHRRSARVGLLFSAGVDSFYSLAKLWQFNATPDYLINVNAGSQDVIATAGLARLANIAGVATKLEVPLLTLDTNFHQLFDEPHLRCHTIRNLCARFALRPWVETFGYSAKRLPSGLLCRCLHPRHQLHRSNRERKSDPEVIGRAAPWLRRHAARKTEAIASDPLVQALLHQWRLPGPQERLRSDQLRGLKCVRTIIMLDHLGHLDAFQACFDLAHYQNNRAALVTRLSESSQALDREAVVLLAT